MRPVGLLDEWLAGLNPTELATGIELIHALRKEGRTIVLVEHVMDAIRSGNALVGDCLIIHDDSKTENIDHLLVSMLLRSGKNAMLHGKSRFSAMTLNW